MELLQLKYFITVASMEHISKAAEMLHVSQPSLSKTISRLEKELGIPLFDRYSRNIKLNENGRIFLNHIERAFFEIEEAQIEIRNRMGSNKKILSVAATSSEIISDVFDEFSINHPNVIYKSHIFDIKQIEELLILKGLDLAVAELYPYSAFEGWEVFAEDELFVVVPKKHRLSSKSSVDCSDLFNEIISIYPSHSNVRDKMESLFHFNGFLPHIFFEDDSPAKVLTNMLRSEGISFISRNLLHHVNYLAEQSEQIRELLKSIKLIRVKNPMCVWQIGAKATKQNVDTDLCRDFISCVKEQYEKRSAVINDVILSLLL